MAHAYDVISVVVPILLIVFLIISVPLGWLPLSYVEEAIPYAVFTIAVSLFIWGQGKRLENALGKKTSETKESPPYKPDPTFDHLQFHFLKEKDDETPMTSRLRYLIDASRGSAYLMHQIPDWLNTIVEGHSILWTPYDNIRDLKRYIQEAKLAVTDIPPSPQAVGLKYVHDSWQKENLYADLLDKIGKNKIEDLLIARLERRYFFSIRRRTLIVDFSAQEIWLMPLCWRVLIQNSIVADETYAMKWREKCKDWAKRWSKEEFGKEFHFNPNHYPESLLITKSLVKPAT